MKIRPVVAGFVPCRRMDRRTDTTNLIVALRNFVKVPKILQSLICVIGAVYFLQMAVRFVIYPILEELCAHVSMLL